MLDVEILVAPALEAGIDLGAEGRAGLGGRAVPVARVLLEAVIGGEIESAAEPEDGLRPIMIHMVFRLGQEEPDIGVGGGDIGVLRVDHERHAQCPESSAGQLRSVGGGRRRQGAAEDLGEVDPGLLEDPTPGQDARTPAAAFGPLPAVLGKACGPILSLDGRTDPLLQVMEIGPDRLNVDPHRRPPAVPPTLG